MHLLEMHGVTKVFGKNKDQGVLAVDDVSIEIAQGETLALIGESGSGKSTLGRLALGLIPVTNGSVFVDGVDITAVPPRRLRSMRPRMQIVFQEPYQSLNPRRRVGSTIAEPLRIHFPDMGSAERAERVREIAEAVGLPASALGQYPRSLSGGQQQRVGIARAIVTRPALVVLDEPTSSLDLSVRAQILNLLRDLQAEFGMSYLFISHDIATVRHVSDRLAVMYLGRLVETGPAEAVMAAPEHPYTRALLSAGLSPDPRVKNQHFPLVGDIPSASERGSQCVLVGRCPIEIPACRQQVVPLQVVGERSVACLRAGEGVPIDVRSTP